MYLRELVAATILPTIALAGTSCSTADISRYNPTRRDSASVSSTNSMDSHIDSIVEQAICQGRYERIDCLGDEKEAEVNANIGRLIPKNAFLENMAKTHVLQSSQSFCHEGWTYMIRIYLDKDAHLYNTLIYCENSNVPDNTKTTIPVRMKFKQQNMYGGKDFDLLSDSNRGLFNLQYPHGTSYVTYFFTGHRTKAASICVFGANPRIITLREGVEEGGEEKDREDNKPKLKLMPEIIPKDEQKKEPKQEQRPEPRRHYERMRYYTAMN